MTQTIPAPLALVAELTHRCPLHCVYCSNPIELAKRDSELTTETWSRLFREAAELGILQVDFTGGEPLARTDIVALVRSAREAGLYVSLISSGLPLDQAKLAALVSAGLDHFQLSFQGAGAETAREISGTSTHAQKLRVLDWLKSYRIGLTLNFVIHRQNIHELEEMLASLKNIRLAPRNLPAFSITATPSPIAPICFPPARSSTIASPPSSKLKSASRARLVSCLLFRITTPSFPSLASAVGDASSCSSPPTAPRYPATPPMSFQDCASTM
jgi:hypothetical protein